MFVGLFNLCINELGLCLNSTTELYWKYTRVCVVSGHNFFLMRAIAKTPTTNYVMKAFPNKFKNILQTIQQNITVKPGSSSIRVDLCNN